MEFGSCSSYSRVACRWELITHLSFSVFNYACSRIGTQQPNYENVYATLISPLLLLTFVLLSQFTTHAMHVVVVAYIACDRFGMLKWNIFIFAPAINQLD